MKILVLAIAATISVAVLITVALNTAFAPEPPALIKKTKPAPQGEVYVPEPLNVELLLRYTNEERVKAGVPPLVLDTRLNQSAQIKADDLAANGYGESRHIGKDGRRGASYIFDTMPECPIGTENLVENPSTSQNVVAGWMGSKLHREALLNPENDLVGFGIRDRFAVQHFCDL